MRFEALAISRNNSYLVKGAEEADFLRPQRQSRDTDISRGEQNRHENPITRTERSVDLPSPRFLSSSPSGDLNV